MLLITLQFIHLQAEKQEKKSRVVKLKIALHYKK